MMQPPHALQPLFTLPPLAPRFSHMFFFAEVIQVRIVYEGIGLGAAIAVVCSWQRNRSIILAAIAGFFSWFYVIYFALTRRPDETRSGF